MDANVHAVVGRAWLRHEVIRSLLVFSRFPCHYSGARKLSAGIGGRGCGRQSLPIRNYTFSAIIVGMVYRRCATACVGEGGGTGRAFRKRGRTDEGNDLARRGPRARAFERGTAAGGDGARARGGGSRGRRRFPATSTSPRSRIRPWTVSRCMRPSWLPRASRSRSSWTSLPRSRPATYTRVPSGPASACAS